MAIEKELIIIFSIFILVCVIILYKTVSVASSRTGNIPKPPIKKIDKLKDKK